MATISAQLQPAACERAAHKWPGQGLETFENLFHNLVERQLVFERVAVLIGYARVSKGDDQSTAAQNRALTDGGCERLFEEAASGGRWDRPQLHRMLDH
jgi:hypothetical protein